MAFGRVAAWATISAFFLSSAAIAERLPAAAYGRLPDVQSVVISPDGAKLAMLAGNTSDERSILVVPIEGGGSPTRIPTGDERPIGVQWFSNDRIGVYALAYETYQGGSVETDEFRLVLMNIDGTRPERVEPAVGIAYLDPDDEQHVLLVGATGGFDTERVRSGGRFEQSARIFKLNVDSGRSRTIETGPTGSASYVLGATGEAHLRIDNVTETVRASTARELYYAPRTIGRRYFARLPGTDRWSLIHEGAVSTDPDESGVDAFGVAGLNAEGTKALLVGRMNGADRVGLYEMDLASGEISDSVFTPPWSDLDGVRFDRFTNTPLGYSWTEGAGRVHYWDPLLAELQAALEESFPDSEVYIANWDQARRKFVINIQGGTVANNYYLYDNETGDFSLISRAYPEIPDTAVNPRTWHTYTARDGMKLYANLTLPVDRAPRNLPAILVPHGGPEARNQPGFDGELLWGQFLANRGYAVIQPEPRHSGGFGRAYARAGYGKWGREMQNDLTDALQHFVDQGIVDPDRVCIVGWSYGGYAAAAGATITPDLYRCAVVGAAVTDLPKFIEVREEQTGFRSPTVEYWNRILSTGATSRDAIAEVSPARLAANVRAPVMIVHGEIDTNVPIEQGELLADALERAGKPYEFVRLEGEGHNLLRGETRTQWFEALDRFLEAHNPPD